MKKLILLAAAAALIGSAPAFAADAAAQAGQQNTEDASARLLAQVQTFKKANTGVSEDAAPAEQKQAPATAAENKAPETKAAQAPAAAAAPAAQTAPAAQAAPAAQQKSQSASIMDQIVREEAAKAAKEEQAAPNNRGVVNVPAEEKKEAEVKQEQQAPAPAKPAEEKKETVQIPAQKQEPAKTETPAAAPAPAVTVPAPAPAPAAAVSATEEIPAGRPLNPSPMKEGDAETKDSILVSPAWLKANRGSVILVDARPDSLYANGHIPGAVNAPWTYFANVNTKQGSEKWGTIWPADTMAKRLGALGIDGKKMVVTYCDAGGWGQSGWTLWILRQAGIKNAKMLDGGIAAWKTIGGEMTKNKHANKTVGYNLKQYVPNYVVTTEWINNNLGKPGLVLLDVRTDVEYLGKIAPFQEKRRGHLPGAINIPRESFLRENLEAKYPDDIKALLLAKGITPDNEIVVYDTAGVRSAYVLMLLRAAGFRKSLNYDAGFQAWAGDPELPIVKP